jgi:CubicO group peptidase (beta-lactamase class C family)
MNRRAPGRHHEDGRTGGGTWVPDGTPRGYGWEGGSGTAWRNDPVTGLTGILLTQRMMTSPEPPEVARDSWSRAHAAITTGA